MTCSQVLQTTSLCCKSIIFAMLNFDSNCKNMFFNIIPFSPADYCNHRSLFDKSIKFGTGVVLDIT